MKPTIRDLSKARIVVVGECKTCGQTKDAKHFPKIRGGPKLGAECHACRWGRYKAKHSALKRTAEGRAKIQARRRNQPRTDAKKEDAKLRAREYRATKMPKEHWRAYNVFQAALRKGILVRPLLCEKCGKNPGVDRRGLSLIHAHHHDYQLPLDVEWLCNLCHSREHYPLEIAA